jgi:hypothetical protein
LEVGDGYRLAVSDFCDYYTIQYYFERGRWIVTGGYCEERAVCEAQIGEIPTPRQPPCDPIASGAGERLSYSGCIGAGWDAAINVSTACPVNEVIRTTYPRVLVATPVEFTLTEQRWSPSEEGNASNAVSPGNLASLLDGDGNPTQAGVWRNLRLKMRSQRFYGMEQWHGEKTEPPVFEFPERSGRELKYPVRQSGPIAKFQWEAASADGEKRGRRYSVEQDALTASYDAPAYKIMMQTSCGHYWQMEWEESEEYIARQTGCVAMADPLPVGYTRDGCVNSTEAQLTEKKYRWKEGRVSTGWQPINLKRVPGLNVLHTYALQRQTRAGGYFKGALEFDPQGEMWVSVVEVQSVLRSDACAADRAQCPRP